MATKSSIMDTNSYSDDYSSLLSNTTRDMINRHRTIIITRFHFASPAFTISS